MSASAGRPAWLRSMTGGVGQRACRIDASHFHRIVGLSFTLAVDQHEGEHPVAEHQGQLMVQVSALGHRRGFAR